MGKNNQVTYVHPSWAPTIRQFHIINWYPRRKLQVVSWIFEAGTPQNNSDETAIQILKLSKDGLLMSTPHHPTPLQSL